MKTTITTITKTKYWMRVTRLVKSVVPIVLLGNAVLGFIWTTISINYQYQIFAYACLFSLLYANHQFISFRKEYREDFSKLLYGESYIVELEKNVIEGQRQRESSEKTQVQ